MGYHTKDAEPDTVQLSLTHEEFAAITAMSIVCEKILSPSDTEKLKILKKIQDKCFQITENFKD
jgi:hypothetical protein